MGGLVTAQLWAAFSVQLPMLEMQAPIQKIRKGRCRKTSWGLPMAERDKPLALSNIKDSYQFNRPEKRDLPARGLRGWSCLPMHVLRSGFLTSASLASWHLIPRSET